MLACLFLGPATASDIVQSLQSSYMQYLPWAMPAAVKPHEQADGHPVAQPRLKQRHQTAASSQRQAGNRSTAVQVKQARQRSSCQSR